jgi:signal transduction histidine kinase
MRRILTGILVLCALALLLAASSSVLVHWTASGKDEVLLDEVQDLVRAQQLEATSQREAYKLRSYLLTGAPGLREEHAQTHRRFRDVLASIEKHTSLPRARTLLDSIQQTALSLEQVTHQLIAQREQGVPVEKAAEQLELELQPLRARMDSSLSQFIELKRWQLLQAQRETERSTAVAFALTWVMSLGTLLLVLGLVWSVMRHARAVQRSSEFERQLIGIVTHDLRSPLSALLITTSLLARRLKEADNQTALARIEHSARRMESVIQLLLDFTRARLGSGLPLVRAPMDMRELCRAVLEEARAGAPERTLTEEYEGDLSGQWDAARLAQLLANLLQNALKYSPEDTPVHVRAEALEGVVRVHVHNLGEPIPPRLMPMLFQPLLQGPQTEKTVRSSLGLGLFIVRAIVEAHQGRIDVHSTAEAGTTFSVTLPRSG